MKYSDEQINNFKVEAYKAYFDLFILSAKSNNFKWNEVIEHLTIDNGPEDFSIFNSIFPDDCVNEYYNEYFTFKFKFFNKALETYIVTRELYLMGSFSLNIINNENFNTDDILNLYI